jgi:hypothetical protein
LFCKDAFDWLGILYLCHSVVFWFFFSPMLYVILVL